jgi:hypothetical protein
VETGIGSYKNVFTAFWKSPTTVAGNGGGAAGDGGKRQVCASLSLSVFYLLFFGKMGLFIRHDEGSFVAQ